MILALFFNRYCSKQTNEGTPSLICIFFNSHLGHHTKIYNKGTPSLMCILNFHLVPNVPKCFNISRLFSANHSYFFFFFKHNVVLCKLFPMYCYFICQLPPPQTSAVKTLPLHTPLVKYLVFFSPMNSLFDFFALTNFFSVSICSWLCIPYSSYVLLFHLYISATPPPYQNRYSPTANIIDYLDPGTMPQQNSTVIISTTVLKTVYPVGSPTIHYSRLN